MSSWQAMSRIEVPVESVETIANPAPSSVDRVGARAGGIGAGNVDGTGDRAS